MKTFAHILNSATDRLSRIMFACGGLAVLAILGLTLAGISLRALGSPLRGVVEISGFLGAAAVGLCLPRAQRMASHIEAGILYERLPVPLRQVQQVLISALSIAFMLLLAAEMKELGLFVAEGDERIDGWSFGYQSMVYAVALGCVGQALVLINDLVQAAVYAYSNIQKKEIPSMNSAALNDKCVS